MKRPYYAQFFKTKEKEPKKEDFNVLKYCPQYIIEEDDCEHYKMSRGTGISCFNCDGSCFSTTDGTCHWYERKLGKYNFSNVIEKILNKIRIIYKLTNIY